MSELNSQHTQQVQRDAYQNLEMALGSSAPGTYFFTFQNSISICCRLPTQIINVFQSRRTNNGFRGLVGRPRNKSVHCWIDRRSRSWTPVVRVVTKATHLPARVKSWQRTVQSPLVSETRKRFPSVDIIYPQLKLFLINPVYYLASISYNSPVIM